jgi:membrane protein
VKPRYLDLWRIDWRHTARRVWAEIQLDDCFGAAAQLAFYFLLAFFPFVVFLAATATLLVRMPEAALESVVFQALAGVMPAQALTLIQSNVSDILGALHTKNLRLLTVSVLLALWTASGGMRAVIVTLNRAYNVREGRRFLGVYGISLLLTIGLTLTALVALPLFGLATAIRDELFATAGPLRAQMWDFTIRLIAAVALAFGIELVYHFAPNVRRPWHWLTAGSIVAVALWFLATWAFSRYVSHFGRYEAIYAGLGAPIVLLLWFYITGLAVLIGGEINAEIERQSGFIPPTVVPAPPTVDAAGHDTTIRDHR